MTSRNVLKRHPLRLFLVMLMLCVPAWGLGNCSDQPSGEQYWIYFDGLKAVVPGASAKMAQLRKEFVSTIRAQIIQLNSELQNEKKPGDDTRSVELAECGEERSPTRSNEFDVTELKLLNQRRVLLEVWGNVDANKDSSELGYVLVPPKDQVTPAVYVQTKSLLAGTGKKKPVFRENPELTAYAQIVIGLRYFNNREYPEASSHLCRGKILLQKVVQPMQSTTNAAERLFVSQQQSLISGVEKLAAEAVSQAGANSSVGAALNGATGSFQCPAL